MKKSKYFHHIKVSEKKYAVFNSLIMKIEYIDDVQLNHLLNSNFDKISIDAKNNFLKKGILITDDSYDRNAYELLYNYYMKTTKKIDTIYLVVSQGCNLGCKYCFLENEAGNWQNKMMPWETAKLTIDKFVSYINKFNIKDPIIMLFGGEPLYNWKIVKDIVEYCYDKFPNLFNNSDKADNIAFRMVTNGTLINSEKAKFMKKYNIVAAISLDGPKEINDENRVFKNSDKSVYNTVKKSIEILKKEECDFGLSITLSSSVVNDRDNIIKWLKEIDVKNIYFNPLHYDTNIPG